MVSKTGSQTQSQKLRGRMSEILKIRNHYEIFSDYERNLDENVVSDDLWAIRDAEYYANELEWEVVDKDIEELERAQYEYENFVIDNDIREMEKMLCLHPPKAVHDFGGARRCDDCGKVMEAN